MEMGTALAAVNWLAVLLAALSMFVLGGLWYAPFLFGKAWMAANGFTEEDLKGGSPARIFGGSFVLALLAAGVLALFLGAEADLAFGLTAGLLVGVGWVAAAFGITYLFERRPVALFAVNAGYHVVAFAVMGAILGAF